MKNLYFILKNPEIDKKKKKEFLKELVEFSSGKYLLNLLFLLIDKERVLLLEDIYREVERLNLEKQNIRKITIEVSHPLTDMEKEDIKKWFEKQQQIKVILEEKLNPELLGGMRVYYKDLVLDATLTGRIKEIYQKIIEE
jgi:F-type H+-transporting ATPase subunit delta